MPYKRNKTNNDNRRGGEKNNDYKKRKGKSNNIRSPYTLLPKLDSLDMQIIDELLANADTSSTAIASKYNVPLSTIQRRKVRLKSMSVLKHEYALNPVYFGLRHIRFLIKVERGKADEVGKHIFEKYQNILGIYQHINDFSNLGVEAYVNSSEQLYDMIEGLESTRFIMKVGYAEVTRTTHTRQMNFLKLEALQKPIQ
ncbi:MAG: AsnC family transcriptional regulator [Thermoproteota archaeon]|nr:AsnC family transcriptional regulator [Thermoproteota archaeon]